MADSFPSIRFKGDLRPAQREVVEIARAKLAAGHRQLHIVAPPGSGKTVLGLYLWAECVRLPALVLSPNSAIQAQWVARADLFALDGTDQSAFSADPQTPGLFTSLTYQAVTLPARGGADLDAQAVALWQERLIEKGQARDPDEARAWIDDLARHNPDYHNERLGSYRKEIRDAIAMGGAALTTLHASALATLDRLKQRSLGLIILDECHHLLSHWGRVLADVRGYFDQPIIVGLTATPPERRGKAVEDLRRYDEFFGPIDYEVPVPAVVKDGYLAPYQDLVLIVRPNADELAFIANADRQLHELIEELCAGEQANAPQVMMGRGEKSEGQPIEPLPRWLTRMLAERRLPVGTAADWETYERREPAFSLAARQFLMARGLALPTGVPAPSPRPPTPAERGNKPIELSILIPVLDRYVRQRLRGSGDPTHHARAEQLIERLRMLGVQITETGTQACASPVGRVLMYAGSKAAALVPILKAERRALGERIRAVVVTDFERTSAVTPETTHLLSDEAGGAIAAFRTLLSDPETDALDPVLVTGSSVLVDDDLAPRLLEAAVAWLADKKFEATLTYAEERGFKVLNVGSPGTELEFAL